MPGYERMDIQYFGGDDFACTVSTRMRKLDGSEVVDISNAATEDGPADEVLGLVQEIQKLQRDLRIPGRLLDFSVSVTSSDSEAKGRAVVRIQDNDVVYEGSALGTNIKSASIRALMDALNKRARFEAVVATHIA